MAPYHATNQVQTDGVSRLLGFEAENKKIPANLFPMIYSM
jgi:hypothetical protein